MMIGTLFRREWRINYKIVLIFCGIFTLYTGVIISMFDPEMGGSLQLMMESMPELFSAFGMNTPGATLLEFLANYLYGFLLICLPLVMILFLSSRLMARYIDRGSMACLLATPHSRTSIALTQAVVLAMCVLAAVVYETLCGLVLSEVMFPGELDGGQFVWLNFCLLGMLEFLAGLCFCSACSFQESRWAIGVGAGLCIVFVLLQMLGQMDESWEFLLYLTPLTLFDPKAISAGDGALWQIAVLFVGSLVLYGGGIGIFSRRDLTV